ncbi:MAG TPA: hypothetical protein VMK31_04865 [Sphingomicrobium sp.]|nr:hypothetical protein [Sphingomicrobium sp.]
MRRILAASLSLLAVACATSPRVAQPGETPASSHTRGDIIGRTAEDLVARFGTPALQIREGSSLKLQFRSAGCVLDAYLYPSGNAPYRVTYVDARTPALADMDQALCVESLGGP